MFQQSKARICNLVSKNVQISFLKMSTLSSYDCVEHSSLVSNHML